MIIAATLATWLAGTLFILLSIAVHNNRSYGNIFAYLAVISYGLGSVVSLLDLGWAGYVASLTLLFDAINANRLISDRYPENLLKGQVLKDLIGLVLLRLIVLSILVLANSVEHVIDLRNFYYIGLLAFMTVLLVNVIRSIIVYKFKAAPQLEVMPSVSLVIAARNETHALAETMRTVIKSSYPKLETLVLDDCSQDSTPELIKSFAGDGIRFVQGEKPASGWLGKNFAYQTLLEEASGEYILICGTDIHYQPETINKLVNYAVSRDLEMLCVLPQKSHFDVFSVLTQPLRVYWQLALPKWLSGTVPVSSTCSLVKKSFLKEVGGFERFAGSIVPEIQIAKLARKRKKYSFVISDSRLGVTTRKRVNSQVNSVIRTLYPTLKKSLSLTLLGIMFLTLLLLLPIMIAVQQVLVGENPSPLIMLALVMFFISHMLSMLVTNPNSWWLSALNLPAAVLLQLVSFAWSMSSYEFGSVEWKGRNICLPVLSTKNGITVHDRSV